MSTDMREGIQPHVDQWRAYVLARGSNEADLVELEAQLRDHVIQLGDAGLDAEEAFLVALKRVADDHEVSRQFVREYCGELWIPAAEAGLEQGATRNATTEFVVMIVAALAAALAVKAPELLGYEIDADGASFYARNLSLFVLPLLAAYLGWKRALGTGIIAGLAGAFVLAAVLVNAFPFASGGSTEILTMIHLPIVLWLVVGVAHGAGEWKSGARRMEYVRFTGEWLVNYALIGLGGGVLIALSVGVFSAIDVDVEPLIEEWMLSCAVGAVIVAAWLVETRRNLVGGMAPMLARVFTPLFAVMLVALLGGVLWTRGVIDVEREVLLIFDLLLVVVLALVLYAVSERDRLAGPGTFDWVQLVLVVCALGVDVFALVNIAGRLGEYGLSANRAAVLGLNLILLVNLAYSAFLQVGFVRGRRAFEPVERWQMRYLPVYALWSATVVVAFPLLFDFA